MSVQEGLKTLGIDRPTTPPAIVPLTLAERLEERRFDFANPPPQARPILRLMDVTIATPGNLSVIAAQAKAGKSAVVGAIIASILGTSGDTLGMTSVNEHDHAVIHLDTEQAPFDHHTLVANALRRVESPQPSCLYSYCVVELSPQERCAALEFILANAHSAHGGVHIVLLDGIADFVNDPNDPEESFSAVSWLHSLAIRYDTHIACVLHFNPGGGFDKTRGHLGSQLERKAETNLALEKDASGVTTVYTKNARHAVIDKAHGQHFRWNDEAGMHVSCGTSKEDQTSDTDSTLQALVDAIFPDKRELRYTDLKREIMRIKKVKECAAEKTLRMLTPRFVHKMPNKTYVKT